MRRALTEAELRAALDRWEGQPVSLRLVGPSDQLVLVSVGRLGARSDAKRPSAFWPLRQAGEISTAEQPGLYVHPGRVTDAVVHPGGSVIEWCQDAVTVNVRLLSSLRCA